MNLLVVGSVAFDDIKTPFGQAKHALGGSATYVSLSASHFVTPSIIAVAGEDFTRKNKKILQQKKIDLSGLLVSKGKTFAWGGEYNFDMNSRTTLFTHLNVLKHFQPKLNEAQKNIPYVFLGNIDPGLQLSVLKQLKKTKIVGCDTMNYWIESKNTELKKVLKLIDIFVINEEEAKQFSKQHNLMKAAKSILKIMKQLPNRIAPVLIIKQGEHGLLMFQNNQRLNLPGYLLEDVIDPTGAGDTFAGGFMGYLAKTQKLDWLNLKKCAACGTVMASFCVEKLGTQALQTLEDKNIHKRLEAFKHQTHFSI